METLSIFYGDKTIKVPKNSNFNTLKKIILEKDGKLVKYFSYANQKINESLLVYDYPSFILTIDQNEFKEYKKGKYRCKRCRKYLKISKWTCSHTNKCRAFYVLANNLKDTFTLEGGYEEDKDDEIIDKIINRQIENNRKSMLNKINALLFGK